jgi:hypothetical protein
MLATIATSTTQTTLALDPSRDYTIIHNSKNAARADDINDIFLAINESSADGAVGEDKYLLSAGRAAVIGPGISILKYKSAAGAPTFGIASSNKYETYK